MAGFEKLGITSNTNRAVSPAAATSRPSEDVAREVVKPSSDLSTGTETGENAEDVTHETAGEDVKKSLEDSNRLSSEASTEQSLEPASTQIADLGLGADIVEKKAENRSRSRKPTQAAEAKKEVEMEMQ
jgi:hypothetical protein